MHLEDEWVSSLPIDASSLVGVIDARAAVASGRFAARLRRRKPLCGSISTMASWRGLPSICRSLMWMPASGCRSPTFRIFSWVPWVEPRDLYTVPFLIGLACRIAGPKCIVRPTHCRDYEAIG